MNHIFRDGNLQKMMHRPKGSPFPNVIGTFMGRDALSAAVSILKLSSDNTVLLPAYLCKEVLRPFLGRTRVEFYDIRPDLSVDPEDIKRKFAKSSVKMMLMINYFGFLQPHRKELKELCTERGVILIEDCAHSPLTIGSGETGDIAIYSFRKILPLPDGGGLSINMTGTEPRPDFYPRIYSNTLSLLILAKLFFNVKAEAFSRAGITEMKNEVLQERNAPGIAGSILPISMFAYNGIGNANFSEITEKRRRAYRLWQETLEGNRHVSPVFSDLPSGVCPMGFPVRTQERDLVKARAQEKGIHLQIHWTLPEVIVREYENSLELSRQTMTLPVGAELGQKERIEIQRLLAA
jgi:dTDP-4-amino-4,6-dideoxygalactose transaminase